MCAVFIFLRAGYSTHKRFVLGGEECAAPFSSKTVVAYWADGCSPVDKGEIGPSHWRRAGSQVYHGRIQSRLQHPFRTRLSARFTSQIRHPSRGLSPDPRRNESSLSARD